MFIHPSALIFLITILTSVIIVVTSNNLLIRWLALEVNILSFLPLILTKRKYSAESAVKYFITQTLASIILIIAILRNSNYTHIIILVSLLLKIGAAPLHQWLISLREGLSWDTILILITIQKLPPLVILITYKTWNQLNLILIAVIVFSSIIGPIGGIIHNSLRKMLIYSSVANMRWMFAAIYANQYTLIGYFLVYTLINMPLTNCFKKNQLFLLNQIIVIKKDWYSLTLFLNILSLAGIPPILGFLPKILVIKEMINIQMILVTRVLLLSTLISLFFYIRITMSVIITRFTIINQKKITISKSEFTLNIILVSLPPLILIILDFKLNKTESLQSPI